MEQTDWLAQVMRQIDLASSNLDKSWKRLRVDQLRRIAARVDSFSAGGCEECSWLKPEVVQLVTLIEQVNQGGRFDRRQYQAGLRKLINHLKSKHRLVEQGTYLLQFEALGMLLGAILMRVSGPVYVGIGLCLGIAVGSAWDAKAKQEGKVI